MKREIESKLYRLYTEDKKGVAELVAAHLENFTIFHGACYWHGGKELTICIEVLDDTQDGTITAKFSQIVKGLIAHHGQFEILLIELECKAYFLNGGKSC